jgi:hypothetical protein
VEVVWPEHSERKRAEKLCSQGGSNVRAEKDLRFCLLKSPHLMTWT